MFKLYVLTVASPPKILQNNSKPEAEKNDWPGKQRQKTGRIRLVSLSTVDLRNVTR
jgi:hypothetical protein